MSATEPEVIDLTLDTDDSETEFVDSADAPAEAPAEAPALETTAAEAAPEAMAPPTAHVDTPAPPTAHVDTPAPPTGGIPAPKAYDFKDLFREATQLTQGAVQVAQVTEEEELAAMGRRLQAEQGRLFDSIMSGLPEAVREAAAKGQRTATVLRFSGADKLDEFCYLYMLKGPQNPEDRAQARRAGAVPLLRRLRDTLHPAGFKVWHAWQRANNDNTLTVSW